MFQDRRDAGERLANRLGRLEADKPVVLGLPRGGVAVACEVARSLRAPLDVLVVRKLGVPFQPELAMGAVGEGGLVVANPDVIMHAAISDTEFETVRMRELRQVNQRVEMYRGGRPGTPLKGRTAVVVDDGVATGSTALAALRIVRAHGAARVVLAVPVASPEALRMLRPEADEIECLESPSAMIAVGAWYRDFSPTRDEEVVELLEAAELFREVDRGTSAAESGSASSSVASSPVEGDPPPLDEEVLISTDTLELPGHLHLPESASGVVVFAHGSGSSRHSPRNRMVARELNDAGLGTLLFDLLSPDEALDRRMVFDVKLLAARLSAVTRWLRELRSTESLPIGYFGASTGAAAALWAAAGDGVAAVVSRGGRPDLAEPRLGSVSAPTLLIVGGRDDVVLGLNHSAELKMTCERHLAVVPGATHLFEEPGALDEVSRLASGWFTSHFTVDARGRDR